MAKNGTAQCILVLVVLVVLQDLCSSASLRNPSRLGACAQQCSWSCGLILSGGQGNRSNGPNPNEIQLRTTCGDLKFMQNAPKCSKHVLPVPIPQKHYKSS
jgi:hypothetical protein